MSLLNCSKAMNKTGLLPEILVNVDSGSSVTATYNGNVISGTSVDNKCKLEIPEFGTWVVSATLGSSSATQNVVVNCSKKYSITLELV